MNAKSGAVLRREMAFAPVLAAILVARLDHLAREIRGPLRVEHRPRDEEQERDRRGERGEPALAPGEHEPDRERDRGRDHEQRRQRQLLHVGAAGDRVDRRARPPLEREPLAHAVGELRRRAAGLRGDARRRAAAAASGPRIASATPVMRPTQSGFFAITTGVSRPAATRHRNRVDLARRVVGAPQEAHVGVLGKAEAASTRRSGNRPSGSRSFARDHAPRRPRRPR